jgi:hypothetical protein
LSGSDKHDAICAAQTPVATRRRIAWNPNDLFLNSHLLALYQNWHGVCFLSGTGDVAVWKHLSTFMEIEK